MPVNFVNPYSGQEEQTCSVSFAAQQQMAGTVSSPQTEAQYHTSKQLGEWGVLTAKLAKGEVPTGTKLLTFAHATNGSRGYLFTKGQKIFQQIFNDKGAKLAPFEATPEIGQTLISSPNFKTAIPQAVNKPTASATMPGATGPVINGTFKQAGVKLGDTFILHSGMVAGNDPTFKEYKIQGVKVTLKNNPSFPDDKHAVILVDDEGNKVAQTGSPLTKWWIEKIVAKESTPAKPTASPTPAPAVSTGSTSVGSMSNEDVSAIFVKVKDDLAKEKGLNVKGANPALDAEVYKAIAEKIGYSAAEVKAKIEAYKATGAKLSALKKKVMAGTYKIPQGQSTGTKPQATKATPAAPLNTPQATNKPVVDPKPNGVPTVATPNLANSVKQEVKKVAAAQPTKVYSDEDVAAAYIIAKDAIVASNIKGWTLYTKNDAFDFEIAVQVGLKTGLNPVQQKQAIANYLASGNKLSVLKKQLVKQGAMKPQADTLKKKNAATSAAEQVSTNAEAGYTPTPTPATGTPPTDTGQPAPKRVEKEAEQSGKIDHITPANKTLLFKKFKDTESKSWLSSGAAANYEGFAEVQAFAKAQGKDYTLLQLIRIADEEGAKKAGVSNGHLFEKQVATWLTTPAGTAHIKANEAKLAEQAEQAKAKAEAEKAAKLLEGNQPPLPADSAQFEDWSLDKALRVSKTWLDADPWTIRQQRDLTHYTSNAYTEMNGYLRGLSTKISDRSKNAIEGAKAGMRPTTEPILVKRGTGANQFISLGVGRGETSAVWGITGKTFKDEGFLRTSAGGSAAFGGEVLLEIECPVGTPMAYVDPISRYPGENEMLLQAGMSYKVLQVRKQGSKFVVRARVVDWPGKEG